jgi:hypothetical protein
MPWRERCERWDGLGHPIVIRRAEPADAEAIQETFLGPSAVAGTRQLPYPSNGAVPSRAEIERGGE